MGERLSHEEIAKIEKERTLNDAEALKSGAEYVIDEEETKQLLFTDEQIESTRREMAESAHAESKNAAAEVQMAQQEVRSPADWRTRKETADETSMSLESIRYFESKILKIYPEWFGSMYPKNGRRKLSVHYAPEFISYIREKSDSEPPENWIVNYALNGSATIILDQFRDDHHEWFDKFRDPDTGTMTEFFSPEAINAAEEVINEAENIVYSNPLTLEEYLSSLGGLAWENDAFERYRASGYSKTTTITAEEANAFRKQAVEQARDGLKPNPGRRIERAKASTLLEGRRWPGRH